MHHRFPQRGFARCIAFATLLASAAAAHAAHTLYVYQSGPDVIAQGSGPINTAGITLFGNTGNYIPDVQPNVGRIAIGTTISTQWQGISGPTTFGTGARTSTSSVTGDFVGIVGVNSSIRLPDGYVSGTPLQNSARWSGQTLASLGVTVGTYTYTWGSGPTSDSYTLVIGSAPPQTITFNALGTQTLGARPTVTAIASSGLPVSFTSATPTVCTVTTAGVVTLLNTGTCTINADQAGDGSFPAAPRVQGSFAVAAAPTPVSVPTLSQWGLFLMSLMVAGFGVAVNRRRG